jgi:hypothetical protein
MIDAVMVSLRHSFLDDDGFALLGYVVPRRSASCTSQLFYGTEISSFLFYSDLIDCLIKGSIPSSFGRPRRGSRVRKRAREYMVDTWDMRSCQNPKPKTGCAVPRRDTCCLPPCDTQLYLDAG